MGDIIISPLAPGGRLPGESFLLTLGCRDGNIPPGYANFKCKNIYFCGQEVYLSFKLFLVNVLTGEGVYMFKSFRQILGVCACLLVLGSGLAYAYDYPFTDRYVATVIGSPEEYAEALPKDIPLKYDKIKMFPDREVPDILWNFEEMGYSHLQQKGPAPLIFLVAGPGASYHSSKMQNMQKAFFQAGYHVISLSSPTHPNFIVAALTSGVPGLLSEDSADLYRVMQAVWKKLQKKMDVTEFFLTGYSLGAAESAFIAKLDEQEKAFNFSKVLLINPPVSLYNSVLILDEMLEMNIPGGPDNFNALHDRFGHRFCSLQCGRPASLGG
jgi:hypothetical protein